MTRRIRRCVIPVLAALVFLYAVRVHAVGTVLNEIIFSPAGADTGGEWVELYNAADSVQDLTGWQLYPDGAGYFSFPAGSTLAAKQFVVVHLRLTGTNSASDLYHISATANMSNSAGSAALFSATPRGKDTIKSFVQWGRGGQTWESAAADAGLWERGAFVATTSVTEGSSIGLSSDGVVAGGVSAWSVFSSPSSGSANKAATVSGAAVVGMSVASVTPSGVPSAAISPSASAEVGPTFHVSAGGDRSVAAGSETVFFGKATGLKGDPLQNVRFLWNFGDGEMRDGRALSHIFQIPGLYTVGLHVTSGTDVSSDYIRVLVVPNKIAITDVIEGDNGYVRLKNSGDIEIDVGEWALEDGAGRRFFLPAQSKVAPGAEIAFANSVTGILKTPGSLPFALYYPNLVLVGRWSGPLPEVQKAETKTGGHSILADESTQTVFAGSAAASAGMIPPETRRVSLAAATTSERHGTSSVVQAHQGNNNLFFWVAALAGAGAAAGFFLVHIFF